MVKREFSRKLAIIFIVLGVLCGVAAMMLTLSQPKPAAPVTRDEPAPSAAKPSSKEIASYKVAPDLPKYVEMPSIKVDRIRVFQLGVTKNNTIASPNNIFDAGWYDASAKPGQDGAMFIYGHVSSWEARGAFVDLKKLKSGDTVIVTRGDDRQFTYKVIEAKTYPAKEVPMDKVLAPIKGQQGLNLMTCAGQIIKGTNDFTERQVVYTSLVKS